MLATNLYICVVLVCIVPFAMPLTCSYCSTLNGVTGFLDCKNPINKTCGVGEDHCMTIDLHANTPFNDSKHQMAKNCTNSANCDEGQLCTQYNNTIGKGLITECKVECCKGDFCNAPANEVTDAPTVAASTGTGVTTNTTDKPTTKDVESAGLSVQSVSGLASLLMLVVAIVVY